MALIMRQKSCSLKLAARQDLENVFDLRSKHIERILLAFEKT